MNMYNKTALWLSLPALLLLTVPFVTLISVTHWGHLRLAWGDKDAIVTSLGLGAFSLLLIVFSGLPVAWWLSQSAGRIKLLTELLVMIPLLTPPLAMGILLVSAYGPYSLPGEILGKFGWTLVNNPAAFIMAQWYGAYLILLSPHVQLLQRYPKISWKPVVHWEHRHGNGSGDYLYRWRDPGWLPRPH